MYEAARDRFEAEAAVVERVYLRQAGTLPDTVAEAARRCVAIRAMLRVFRQLDIVLTPTGFGVVSTDNVKPASRERVAALRDELQCNLLSAEDALVDAG